MPRGFFHLALTWSQVLKKAHLYLGCFSGTPSVCLLVLFHAEGTYLTCFETALWCYPKYTQRADQKASFKTCFLP